MTGIKEGYPRLRRRVGSKISAYFQLVRPFTLVTPLVAGFFGILIQLLHDDMFYLVYLYYDKIIYAMFTLVLAQAVGQIVNQVTDVGIDRINKPYRPIVRGTVGKEEAMGIAWFLSIFAFARAFLVSLTFGLCITAILFFALFYNLEPIRVKKRNHWVALTWMALSRGLLPFPTMWCIFGRFVTPLPWFLGAIAFAWVLSFQATKDFVDVKGDMKFGMKTLPIVYGEKQSAYVMAIMGFVTLVLLFVFVRLSYLPSNYVLLGLLIVPLVLILMDMKKESGMLENTRSWMWFYLGLSMIYALSVIAEVI